MEHDSVLGMSIGYLRPTHVKKVRIRGKEIKNLLQL